MSLTGERGETDNDRVAATARPSPAQFGVDVDHLAGQTVLTLRGELDLWAHQTFVAALVRIDREVSRIVLDMSELTAIDAGSIGLLVRSQIIAAERGAELVLRSPTPQVRRILELSGLVVSDEGESTIRPIVLPLPARVYERPRRLSGRSKRQSR